MIYVICALFAVSFALIGDGIYMVFSPKYNTIDDYAALLPIIGGVAMLAVSLVVSAIYAIFKHFFG